MSKGLAHRILQDVLRVRNELGHLPTQAEYFKKHGNYSVAQVNEVFVSWIRLYTIAFAKDLPHEKDEPREPKVLVFDIETFGLIVSIWSLGEQVVRHDQIIKDWSIACWSAKWLGKPEMFSMDTRGNKDVREDRKILQGLWKLLDEADVVLTKNGKRFDQKKVFTRFVTLGMNPPSPFKHIDTEQMLRKNFSLSSSSLEFAADAFDLEHKKSKHVKFPGRKLWDECLAGNPEAWQEMVEYNKKDVLATEDLYNRIAPYGGSGVDLNVFRGAAQYGCTACGGVQFKRAGYAYTSTGKFQRYQCTNKSCGAWTQDRGVANNLFSPRKKESLKGP